MADITVTEEQWKHILEALGLPADADVDTAVAALEDLVTTPPADPEAVAAAAGLTALAPSVVAQLRADAEQGRVLAAAAKERDIKDLVDASFRRGAITPARREHWMTMIKADPTMADTLAKIPDHFAVPLVELGHSLDKEDENITEPAPWFR